MPAVHRYGSLHWDDRTPTWEERAVVDRLRTWGRARLFMEEDLLKRFAVAVATLCLLVGQLVVTAGASAASPTTIRTITRGATVTPAAAPSAADVGAGAGRELPEAEGEDGANSSAAHRKLKTGPEPGAAVAANPLAGANPELSRSFDGINHREHRLANNANQWSLEPPDQGLCAGNGYVLEAVNDALRIYNNGGAARTGVIDLNTFYGYSAAVVRPSGPFGPFVTDPSCLYDQATNRWFLVILTLDVDAATGDFTGTNHLDIAVSTSANPTKSWAIYRLAVQDDGTDGTPDHGCSARLSGTGHGPCIGDYPHIGADTTGFYVTTNEYSFNGPEYKAAQVYAFSKAALAANAASLRVVQIDTTGVDNGNPGFTLWPAISPSGTGSSANGGTAFFLSSNAAEEANGTGSSSDLLVWSLTGTASLASANPSVSLGHRTLAVKRYASPPPATQRAGSTPLADCLNNKPCATVLNGERDKYAPETEYALDSNDTRMQQVSYANGLLWAGLDTAVSVNGASLAGIEYFVVDPAAGVVVANDYVALAGQHVAYPAVATLSSGRGVMAFTVVGPSHFPSAGYALISAAGVGSIHVAAAGAGPADGFSGYKYYGNPPRPRWGDYGAAVVDGTGVWIASEYIAQSCTLAQYQAAPFGSCNGTRTALANWATRISLVTP
jgi:hypothetical protein